MPALLRLTIITLAILACSQGYTLPGKIGETRVGCHRNRNHGLPGMPGQRGFGNYGGRYGPGRGSYGQGFPGVVTPVKKPVGRQRA